MVSQELQIKRECEEDEGSQNHEETQRGGELAILRKGSKPHGRT